MVCDHPNPVFGPPLLLENHILTQSGMVLDAREVVIGGGRWAEPELTITLHWAEELITEEEAESRKQVGVWSDRHGAHDEFVSRWSRAACLHCPKGEARASECQECGRQVRVN